MTRAGSLVGKPGDEPELLAKPVRPRQSDYAPVAGLPDGPSNMAALAESFRTLRSNILLSAAHARTFVITSAIPGEGKSTVAANLACCLSAVHRRVLLIDADLRRPSAHRFFEIPNAHGLTDVLRGSLRPEEAWQSTTHGPTVMTSGAQPSDPQAVLESEHLSSLFERARRQFDLVLIDSAPVLAVSDTMLIVPHADATMLVLRYASVSESDATLALDRLQTAGGKVIGCVLSQVSDLDEGFHTYANYYSKRRRS